ncbi:MAG: Ig-like domain-containing protein [Deltaproteobacteria bacterium]|nr:Ig-like domain-containing protein [Deltaproteobacteria bacterium]
MLTRALLGVAAGAVLLTGCPTEPEPEPVVPGRPDFPAPDAFTLRGPGGPAQTFDATQLWEHCAYLLGGEGDAEHHNLVVMHDGYLLMPWAPEDGGGGISFFTFDDPCNPVLVGEAWADGMRESHSLGFSRVGDREYLAVDYHGGEVARGGSSDDDDSASTGEVLGGVGFFDVTDPANPFWASELDLPGYHYPDSYTRLTLSVFWQGRYVYVSGAGNGVYIVDAADPLNPTLVAQYRFTPGMLVGSFHAFGNVAMAATAGGTRTVLMDISDPVDPQPILGGEFNVGDGQGQTRGYYFSNLGGIYGLFARKADGGGPILYDLRDVGRPRFAGDGPSPEGDGGYVALHENFVFIGDSNFGAVWDFTEERDAVEIGRIQLQGDFDTLVPIGNIAVASVDDGGAPGQATAIVPWQTTPDTNGPQVGLHSPMDGHTFQALTSRIGFVFDEQIEPRSAHAGSVRVWTTAGVAVPGTFNVQETIVNFEPAAPLQPDTTYVVELPAGGVTDVSGNPIAADWAMRFSTGATVVR